MQYAKVLLSILLMFSLVLIPACSPAYPIKWSTERIGLTLEQGDSLVLDESFHSDIELSSVELSVSDNVWPFILVSPEMIPIIEEGSNTTVRIRFFVPSTTQPGTYDGTLNVKQENETYPQVLEIGITVIEAPVDKEVVECMPSGDLEVSVNPNTGAKAVLSQALVIFDSGVTAQGINELLSEYNTRIVGQITVLGVYQIEIPTGADPWAFADLLNADSRVALAGVNDVGEVYIVPSDPAWQDPINDRRWGFEQIKAPEAWDITNGSSDVKLAIVDSGVDLNHGEFAGRLLLGTDYVWGVIPWDLDGHGTTVAGIMAAQGNGGNSGLNGMAGMCWDSDLMVIKIGGIIPPLSFNCIAGIIEASDAGTKVINISAGWYDPGPLTKWLFEYAVDYADKAKALVVAAAGNEDRDEELWQNYPSIVPKVLSVGATDDNDDRAVWPGGQASNFGSTVDVAAPGDEIYTTEINGYTVVGGTSLAAPFASGLAALIWSIDYDDDNDFDLIPADVNWIIQVTADPLMDYPNSDFGGGRINAYNALRQAQVQLLGWKQSRITSNLVFDWTPSISADGTKIAFLSGSEGNRELFIVNSDGSGLTQLTDADALGVLPSISADGTRVAFRSGSEVDPDDAEIFVVNSDGSGLTQLTDNTWRDEWPTINGDGTKIAFESWVDPDREIFIVNADGSGLTQLTNNNAQDTTPSFNTDGTRITFASFDGNDYEIFVMNSDGSGLTQLTNNTWDDHWPTINGDGTRIAFDSLVGPDLDDAEIFVVNSDGSGLTQLTNNTWFDFRPSISADGTKIAFTTFTAMPIEDPYIAHVFIVNSDGSGLVQLTYGDMAQGVPSISGDATKLACVAELGSIGSEIFLIEYLQ